MKLPFFPELYEQGYKAFSDGATTPEQARTSNPFRLFGEQEEHAKAVSWNKGWNQAMRDAELSKPDTIGDYVQKKGVLPP